jgi:hypothetical protein
VKKQLTVEYVSKMGVAFTTQSLKRRDPYRSFNSVYNRALDEVEKRRPACFRIKLTTRTRHIEMRPTNQQSQSLILLKQRLFAANTMINSWLLAVMELIIKRIFSVFIPCDIILQRRQFLFPLVIMSQCFRTMSH